MFDLRTIRAIYYIKPNQNSEDTCHGTFMILCAYNPLTFFNQWLGCFDRNKLCNLTFISQVNFQYMFLLLATLNGLISL